MAHRDVIGWVLLATMLFSSSLAFGVLESAMSVIFHHRVAARRRPLLVSLLIPYVCILSLGLGLLLLTLVAGGLQVLGEEQISRHVLVWYFATLSQIGVVYGSLTTANSVLLSLDLAATLLLLGAQVIAEYERIGREPLQAPVQPLTTEAR